MDHQLMNPLLEAWDALNVAAEALEAGDAQLHQDMFELYMLAIEKYERRRT
ncbi:hypothetical protein [Tsukamurella soli]|uniref:Uncharacterized protein n=1 Tax=Tsukamurella soli TaxID=644556 RepID=A0ABP8JJ92_9ACTN